MAFTFFFCDESSMTTLLDHALIHRALRKNGLLLEQVSPHAQVYRKVDLPAAAVRRRDSGMAGRVGLPHTMAPHPA